MTYKPKRLSRLVTVMVLLAVPLGAAFYQSNRAFAQPIPPGGPEGDRDTFDGPSRRPPPRGEEGPPDARGPRGEEGGFRGGRDGGGGPEEGGFGGNRRGRFQERLRRMQERMNGGGPDAGPGGGGEGGRAFAAPHGARGMNNYMQYVDSLVHSVQDPQMAIGLSALGIRDFYKKQGKVLDSIPVFQELLNNTKEQKERNIYLFLMRQTYKEANDNEKFLELSKQIIKENSAK